MESEVHGWQWECPRGMQDGRIYEGSHCPPEPTHTHSPSPSPSSAPTATSAIVVKKTTEELHAHYAEDWYPILMGVTQRRGRTLRTPGTPGFLAPDQGAVPSRDVLAASVAPRTTRLLCPFQEQITNVVIALGAPGGTPTRIIPLLADIVALVLLAGHCVFCT